MTIKAAPRIHRPIIEGEDDSGPVLTDDQTEQVVDLLRTALGELIDPAEEDEDLCEFWFADFPVVVEFCPGCATVTIQILGNEIAAAHISLEVAESLRDVVRMDDPEDLVTITLRREAVGLGKPLYTTRIAYPVALPDEDSTWAMLAEMVTVFDHLFGVFVARSSRDSAPE